MRIAWVALAIALSGCPLKPPVNPTSDAAAMPTCATACVHYATVCVGGGPVCNETCPGPAQIDTGYTTCIAGATACMNCDATARDN